MDWTVFLIFILASAGAAATGALFPPGKWYEELNKPRWTPPDWAFPVVWTLLYIASSYAAARVAMLDGNAHAMAFWAMQLSFNALWSPIFFGLRRIKAGMVALVFLWVAVVCTCVTFWALDPIAGALYIPYVIWVTTAGALNATVWMLNPEKAAAGSPAGA